VAYAAPPWLFPTLPILALPEIDLCRLA
jgi:hypothetical protein